jgi:hypothetical protein
VGRPLTEVIELTTVQVRDDYGWLEVAVIDGRHYPDRQSYDRAVGEMFETMNGNSIPAQFESRRVSATEPPSRLPAWEDYRATLPPKKAGTTPEDHGPVVPSAVCVNAACCVWTTTMKTDPADVRGVAGEPKLDGRRAGEDFQCLNRSTRRRWSVPVS